MSTRALVGALLVVAGCASSTTAGRTAATTAATTSRPSAPAVTLSGPVGLATAAGRVWAVDADAGTVVPLDDDAHPVRRVAVGTTPLRAVAAAGRLWVSVFGDGAVVAIDPATGRITRRVALDGQPEGVAAGFGSVWVVRQEARALTRLATSGAVVRSWPLGTEPRLVATSARAVFVSDFADGTLTRVDPPTEERRTSPSLCQGPQGLAAIGTTVWLACTTSGRLLAVDETTLRVTGSVAIAGEPDAVRSEAGRLFVAATAGPTVYEIRPDPVHPAVLRHLALGHAQPLADRANVDLARTPGRVWVSSYSEGRVYTVRW